MSMTTEELAQFMHEVYEAAAVKHGWYTNERSRVAWAFVPHENKETMREAVAAVEQAIREDERAKYSADTVNADLRTIMKALGIGMQARDSSPHDVIQNEVLPRIRRVMQYSPETVQSEIRQVMAALNVTTTARSPNEMVQGEILPRIHKMKNALSQAKAMIEKHHGEIKEVLDEV